MHAHPSHQSAPLCRGQRRVGLTLAGALTAAIAASAGHVAGMVIQAPGTQARTGSRIQAGESAPADRAQAARALLDAGDLDGLRAVLWGEEAPADLVVELAQAVANAPSTPDEAVFTLFAEQLGGARSQAEAYALLAVLSRASSKAAVQACVAALQAQAFPAAPSEIVAVLVSITGRDDLGADSRAWISWWESARWLPEVEWRGRLARWRGERARRLEQERDQAYARLATALREMHARLPEPERADRLAALLRDEWAVVRQVGLELAERDLLNARAIGPKVVQGARENLTHPDVRVRRAAAELLARVPNSGASAGARDALHAETDPRAAAALLRLAARAPSTVDVCAVAVDWLKRDDAAEARQSAANLLLTASRAGALESPSVRAHAANALHRRDAAGMTMSEWTLLMELGGQTDRRRLLQLAEDLSIGGEASDAERALALWMILAQRPDTARRVLEIGSSLAPANAVAAAAQRVGEPAAVVALLRNADRAGSQAEARQWRESAATVCLTLSPAGARAVVEEADDAFRVELLREAMDAGSAGEASLRNLFGALADAGVRMGELELTARAGEALASASGPISADGPDALRAQAASIIAALAAGSRLEAADRLTADAAIWVAALRDVDARAWPAAVAERLARSILERFSDELSPDEAAWVASLSSKPSSPENEPARENPAHPGG